MAEEKQETAEPVEGKRKKKRLPPIVLVSLGAMLGGAGVVSFAPRPKEGHHAPPTKVVRLFDHPDPMEFSINPVVERGHKLAIITFKFSYKADEKDVVGSGGAAVAGGGGGEHGNAEAEGGAAAAAPVPAAIKANWDRAYSRCLEVLSNQRAERLLDPEGKRQIKRLLMDEMTATLFPDGAAAVDDILWTKFVVQ